MADSLPRYIWAHSSVVEHSPDKTGVEGSIPSAPTKRNIVRIKKAEGGVGGGIFHLRHPNSRKISRVFCEILSPKNSFCKTSSALFRHLPEYLEDRTPKEKYPFLFQKKFHPRQIEKVRSVFLSGLPSEARQWRNDTSVRGSFKLSRTWGVRLVLSFKISSSKC